MTASKADVLKGKKTVTSDSNDEIVEGTMPNNGAVSYKLPANGSYTIPKGYHNGSGKVTQSLSTQGSKTITPSTSKQTVAVNGKLMTGDIVVNAIPNLRGQYQMAGGWGSGGSGADAYFAMNDIPEGYYQKNGADWAPEVRMKQSDVRSALGVTASKIVSGQSIAGVAGTAYTITKRTEVFSNLSFPYNYVSPGGYYSFATDDYIDLPTIPYNGSETLIISLGGAVSGYAYTVSFDQDIVLRSNISYDTKFSFRYNSKATISGTLADPYAIIKFKKKKWDSSGISLQAALCVTRSGENPIIKMKIRYGINTQLEWTYS